MYETIIHYIQKFHQNKKNQDEIDRNRLSWNEYFMSLAYLVSCRSPCHRLTVGCVIVYDNRIIATGYNGFVAGVKHVSIVENGHEQNKIHAETNAILDSAKRGTSIQGCTAYITHFPCYNCMKNLVASGIQTIFYHEDYKNDKKCTQLAKECNIVIQKI